MHLTTRRGPRLTALTAITAISLFVSGCSGQGAAPQGEDEQGDGPIELTFWHGLTGPDGPAVQQIVDDFNASQDEIEVITNPMPWDSLYQKLLTSISSSSGPDIIAMSTNNLPEYAAKGALAPTTDFYADTTYMDTAPLAPAAVDASRLDGINYGVPLNISPMMMYWNKDLFTQAGLDPEKPPTTWDEFAAMADDLTVDDNGDGKPEIYPIALPDHEGIATFQPLLWNNGGGVVSQDGTTSQLGDPATLEALAYWTDLVTQKKVSPIGLGGADADKLFQTGKAALEIVGPWMTAGFEEAGLDFGVTRPFAGPTDNAVLADVTSLTVSASASPAKQKAAFTFFAYWNSVDGQATWANGSGFPATRTDMPEGAVTNEYSLAFGQPEVLKDSRVYLAGIPAASTITDTIFNPALQTVLNGKGSVEDVFTDASVEVQAELDK